jgi:hypothetical protein
MPSLMRVGTTRLHSFCAEFGKSLGIFSGFDGCFALVLEGFNGRLPGFPRNVLTVFGVDFLPCTAASRPTKIHLISRECVKNFPRRSPGKLPDFHTPLPLLPRRHPPPSTRVVLRLWQLLHKGCRFSHAWVPPVASDLMWSASVAVLPQWSQTGLNLRNVARMRRHLASYPRRAALGRVSGGRRAGWSKTCVAQ